MSASTSGSNTSGLPITVRCDLRRFYVLPGNHLAFEAPDHGPRLEEAEQVKGVLARRLVTPVHTNRRATPIARPTQPIHSNGLQGHELALFSAFSAYHNDLNTQRRQ